LLPIVVRGILQLALEGWGAAAARPLVVAPPELADYAETIAARHGLSSMDDIHIVVDNVSRDVIVGQFEAGRPIVLVEPCTYDGALVETNYNILDGIAARGYGTAERFFIPSDTPVPFRAAGHFSDPFRVEYYLFTPLNQ